MKNAIADENGGRGGQMDGSIRRAMRTIDAMILIHKSKKSEIAA